MFCLYMGDNSTASCQLLNDWSFFSSRANVLRKIKRSRQMCRQFVRNAFYRFGLFIKNSFCPINALCVLTDMRMLWLLVILNKRTIQHNGMQFACSIFYKYLVFIFFVIVKLLLFYRSDKWFAGQSLLFSNWVFQSFYTTFCWRFFDEYEAIAGKATYIPNYHFNECEWYNMQLPLHQIIIINIR